MNFISFKNEDDNRIVYINLNTIITITKEKNNPLISAKFINGETGYLSEEMYNQIIEKYVKKNTI